MNPVPHPTALRSLVKHDDVERHRSLSCGEYDGCLEAVLRRAWRSWTCGRCPLFRLTQDWRAAEISHQAALRPLA
jgi:hypothetical protein